MRSKLLTFGSILIAVAFIAVQARAQAFNLQLQGDYTLNTGAATPRFAIGDLNRDGWPDIVSSTGVVAQPVSILLNNGSGGMGTPALIGQTINAAAVAIGDFNNDGNPDLAISSVTTGSGINIRLGDGSGSFALPGTNTPVVDSTVDIATADFNGDGNLDLVVATPQTNAVKVLLGAGNGTFGSPASFGVGSAPLDLEVADMNSDGRPDMAVVAFTTTNTVSILLNNGIGGFTNAPGISWPNATSAAKVVAGDFNRDCITDLAVNRTDSIAILLGNNHVAVGD